MVLRSILHRNEVNSNVIQIACRHKPLYIYGDGRFLSYSKGAIYELSSEGLLLRRICRLPIPKFYYFSIFLRCLERMLRVEPRTSIMIDSEETLIFSFMGSIYNLNIKSGNLTEEFKFRYGMKNPLYLVKIQGLEGFSDSILFGEYWGNPDNDEVKIYSRNLDQVGEWKEFTRFRTNEVLHIHNILVDKQQSRLLILTGDTDSQSGIWSLDSKGNLNCIVGGEQKFRSCFGFTEGFNLYYATDTPLESNSFMKLDLNTKMLTTITDIEGPVIYGTHCSEGALFSTSVEPDSRIKGWRYLLSTKPALDNNAHIFMFSNGRIIKLLSLEKDYLPMGLFQFGSVQMLSSENKKHTYLYAVGLRGYDSMVFKFKTLGNENE